MDLSTPSRLSPETTSRLLTAAATASPYERSLLEEQVIAAYMPLADRIAGRYARRGIDLDDLRQVAGMALVGAARRFDPQRGDFGPFAAVTIAGEIKKHFRDLGWMVRPPRSVQVLQVAIGRAEEVRARSGDAPLGIDEMASELDVDRAAVVDATAARGCFAVTSLDSSPFGDGRTLGDRVPADGFDLDVIDGWVDFRPAWDLLDDDEKELIRLRFFEDMTQESIAGVVGSSQMQVSRRLKAVLSKIRSSMTTAEAA